MKYRKVVLPNGLRVITVPMPSLESVTLTVWTGVGSRYEQDKVAGLSHFLEHMVFKGSQKRPSAKAISEAVDAIGGEFNAGTTKEWTNFYIKARYENLETAFDVLSDMVLNPLLKKEDIQREKGVILEEMAMYEDTPMVNIGDVFEGLMFGKTPLGRDTIGFKDVIKKAKRNDFLLYRKKYYYPENLVLTISGGINEKKALDMALKYFGGLKSSKNEKDYKKFGGKQVKPQFKLKSKKVEQAHFILGFLGKPKGNPDRYIEGVLASILGGGMSSRLFTEVREKRGLAYSVRTSNDYFLDTGYIGTYAGVDLKKIDEAIKVTLEEHYKMASQSKLTEKELKKAKEYLKGHLALALEDTKAVATFFGDQEVLLGKIDTPEEVFKGIDKVTIKDVSRVAKELFKKERLNLAIIGPYNSEANFEKILK